jgi:hypothetical protein
MKLEEAISGGNGEVPPANPSSTATVPAETGQTGSDRQAAEAGEGSGTGETVKLAAWTQQLSREIRENPELTKKLSAYEKLDDLANAFFALEGKNGIPGRDARPEEVKAFWEKLGYPEKPENYTVSKEKDAEVFVSMAHGARLTDEQAAAMWKLASEKTASQIAALKERQAREIAETDLALQKELGEGYPRAMELLKRTVSGSPAFTLLQQAGLAGKPEIIKAFIALGEASAETGSPRSDSAAGKQGESFMDGKWF